MNDDEFVTIDDDDVSAIMVRKRSPKKMRAKYQIKRKVFGKAAMLTKRGYKVVNEVPEFYYVTNNTMVCPPLDALRSSEQYIFESSYDCHMSSMPFSDKLKKMVPANGQEPSLYSQVMQKVANYMNKKHNSNYIVYNLYRDRQFDNACNLFHQVTEYPFPKASMVEGLSKS